MNHAALSLAQTPPLAVPMRYFVTAPLFAVAAGLVLAFGGPNLLAGRWHPDLLAATHLLTLGYLAMAMAGALQQLLPVLAGSILWRSRGVSLAVHGALALGTAALAAGWLLGRAWPFQAAALLLGAGLLSFIAVVGHGLLQARSAHATVRAMGLALGGLAVTVGLGLHLVTGWGWPGLGIGRHLTDLHLAWGLLGWVLILVAGVSWQVIPMFQMTADYPKAVSRGFALALFGALVWASIADAGLGLGRFAAGLPALLLVCLHGGLTLRLMETRRRRLPDVTLDFWRLSMAALLAAAAAWLLGAPEVVVGLLFIVGFAMSAINGMLYKIVPFLIWLHLNNRLQAAGRFQGKVPNMKQIIPERMARPQFRLHLAAVVLLAAAPFAGQWLTRPAGALLAAAQLFLFVNLLAGLARYRRVLREAAA